MAYAKLLLVEDDVTLIKMYEKKFHTDGYDVSITSFVSAFTPPVSPSKIISK